MNGDTLLQVVLYRKPRDFPDYFVVRRWRVGAGIIEADRRAYCFHNEAGARAWIEQEHPELYPLGRLYEDDPVIVGVWT